MKNFKAILVLLCFSYSCSSRAGIQIEFSDSVSEANAPTSTLLSKLCSSSRQPLQCVQDIVSQLRTARELGRLEVLCERNKIAKLCEDKKQSLASSDMYDWIGRK